jgi:transposase
MGFPETDPDWAPRIRPEQVIRGDVCRYLKACKDGTEHTSKDLTAHRKDAGDWWYRPLNPITDRILVSARGSMSKDRTRSINALNTLTRSNDLGIDARKALTGPQIAEIARWRTPPGTVRLDCPRRGRAPGPSRPGPGSGRPPQDQRAPAHGAGAGQRGRALCCRRRGSGRSVPPSAWPSGRTRAVSATRRPSPPWPGANPVPASSGTTVRHRLNWGGDRVLNSALHLVSTTKMTYDAQTREYVAKRRVEGRTDRKIRRCIKRYLARHVYRTLNATAPTLNAT